MLAALVLLVLAQVQLPPDGGRVLSTGGNLTLTWPGPPRQEYLLQVSLQGQELFAGVVQGPVAHLDAVSAGLYRWKVSTRQGSDWVSEPGYHSFQLQTDPYFRFDGQDSPPTERPSLPGRAGHDGRPVQVSVTPGEPYLTLTINAQIFLMTPDSRAVLSSRGGRGGDGGPATPPGPVPLDAGGTVIWVPGGAGRPPGQGGRGGAGGRVVVSGADARRYLQIHNEGGQGGEPGGAPGPAGQVQWR